MFYSTDQHHGLRHNPFNAIVIPRPIGWISTLDRDGVPNLAPYSFFNAVAYVPPQVIFSATGPHQQGGYKDSIANIEATGEFVVNVATWPLREAMNASSAPAPHGVDEFELAGLTEQPGSLVKAPRVAESPIHLECRLLQTLRLAGKSGPGEVGNVAVLGEVVGVHISDEVLVDGMIDYARVDPIGRLGYQDYVRVNDIFAMARPDYRADRPPS